jgi:HK97 family phage major capsid protein
MARQNFDVWLPEDDDSAVIRVVNQGSAIESLARRVPMTTDVKNHPRSGGANVFTIAKGEAYTEDEADNDKVILKTRKLGTAFRIAEEDLDDNVADIVGTKQLDWAHAYAKGIDNATLATTGAENGTTVKYTSVYRALTTANAATGYTANANRVQTAGPVTYGKLSEALGLVETGDFFDPTSLVVIAHPSFRGHFRNVVDGENRPIFVQGLAGTPDTLFGHTVRWSQGARTHATNSSAPTGNPIAVFGNMSYALLGVRSGPESAFLMPNAGGSALTDEAILKVRARRAFAVGHEKAFSILEVTSGT